MGALLLFVYLLLGLLLGAVTTLIHDHRRRP